jgi:hypothetical protein
MGFNSAFKGLNAGLYTNLHMYYYYSIVDIHVLFTGQMQGYYVGAMDIFFYVWTICLLMDHLPASGLLKLCFFVQQSQFAGSI